MGLGLSLSLRASRAEQLPEATLLLQVTLPIAHTLTLTIALTLAPTLLLQVTRTIAHTLTLPLALTLTQTLTLTLA